MSMLTLNGTVLNVFDTPAITDKKTGEIRPAASRVQISAENTLENGQKRYELVNLKVADGEVYRKLQGKPVRVPVGAFASGGGIVFYALKDLPQVAAQRLGEDGRTRERPPGRNRAAQRLFLRL